MVSERKGEKRPKKAKFHGNQYTDSSDSVKRRRFECDIEESQQEGRNIASTSTSVNDEDATPTSRSEKKISSATAYVCDSDEISDEMQRNKKKRHPRKRGRREGTKRRSLMTSK